MQDRTPVRYPARTHTRTHTGVIISRPQQHTQACYQVVLVGWYRQEKALAVCLQGLLVNG